MTAARQSSTVKQADPNRRPTGALVSVGGLGLAVLLGVLYFALVYAPAEKRQVVKGWEAHLDSMVDDRRAAIAAWVDAGIADAATVAAFPAVSSFASPSAAMPGLAPASGIVPAHLQEVIDGFSRSNRQRAVAILDARGDIIAHSRGGAPLEGGCADTVRELVGAGEPFAEICPGAGGLPLVVFGAPVAGARPEVGRGHDAPGCALVADDPAVWLYPLLTREPLATASGEVTLARGDNGGVLFLSPLRRSASRPLTFRLHSDTPSLAAAAALDGPERFGTFTDYRGAAVLAATRRIPHTSWGLVAKVDREEALARYRETVLSSAVTVFGFALALVGTGFGLWRTRQARYEAALARSGARSAMLLDNANDAILFVSADGRILDANRRAEALYGYGRAELLRLSIGDLRSEDARASLPEHIARAASPGGAVFQTVHRRKGGTRFPVEVSSRIAEFQGERALLSIVRDLSEREAAEERIRILNRLLHAITEFDELMVRERDVRRVLAEVCRIAVEHGRFSMAWVGLLDTDAGGIRLQASAGDEAACLAEAEGYLDDPLPGGDPIQTVVREGRAVVVNDWESETTSSVEGKRSRCYRSSGAFALVVNGQIRGAFAVYADQPGVFEPEIVKLLADLAQDVGFALQVSEGEERRRQAETALRESEERFRALIEKSGDLVVVLDPTGAITFAGPSSINVLGFPPDELVGASVLAFVHPDDVHRVRRLFVGLGRQPGITSRVELRARHRNGSWRVFDAVVRDLSHVRGVRGLVMNARDISERKQAESAVRESEGRYRLLVDNLQDFIVSFSTDGTLTSFSGAFERITGWRPEQWVGKPFASLVHPDDVDAALGYVGRVVRQESPGLVEVRVRARDESWLNVEFTGVALVEDGKLVGAQGTGRDVTQRKHAEETLRLQAQILDQVHEAVVSTDLRGYVTSWNHGAEKLFGYRPVEVLGKHIGMLYPEEGRAELETEVVGALKVKGAHEADVRVVRKGGELVWVHLGLSVLKNGEGKPVGMIGYSLDMTEHRRLEEELRQVQKMEAVGRLAGGVAHDFNNLLQAMLSQVQMIRTTPGDDERVASTAGELEQQIRRGAALSRQLLLFSRRETAKRERLDLNDVVGGATQLLRRLVRENIVFAVELFEEALPVIADRGQLDQVLMNLVVNASDAMPDGGRLTVRTEKAGGGWVWVSVQDTGSGIPEALRDRIFEPFFTTKPRERGSGLGLSVVHGIVAQHGGTIRVSDRTAGGAVFRIELPGAFPVDAPMAQSLSAEEEIPRGGGERVLVIEDEAGAREGLASILDMLGYKVTAAGSAAEVTHLPQQSYFDVVLSDILLPDASGADLARALVQRWPGMRVILMSGYTQDDAVREAVAAGTVRFLQKPFDMRALAREMHEALAAPAGIR
jgi:two-component system cell cycle sensor histidine kinase/response regulator CckA